MAVCGKNIHDRHFFCLQNPFCIIIFFTWAGDLNRPATEKTKMTRLILIDNGSGCIFGDSADLNGKIFSGTAVEFARALDASNGEHGRVYIEAHNPRNTSTGYHVYAATDAVPTVSDGQDANIIKAVERDCDYAGFVAILDQDF